ncbi:hypothetical protein [Streptomyces cucumeris]|uniref:hypothetical protein n=1 Tax=Streptomyces cucumeris TaxID=2962890 RepID=UPI003D71D65A
MFSGKYKQPIGDSARGARQEPCNGIELRSDNWLEVLAAHLVFGTAMLGKYASDPVGRPNVNASDPVSVCDAIGQFRVRAPRG